MRTILFLLTFLVAFHAMASPLVWKDEYVVEPTDSIITTNNGVHLNFEIKGASTYTMLLTLKHDMITAHSNNGTRSLAPYDPATDKCKALDSTYACSPNYFIKADVDAIPWGLGGNFGINAIHVWPDYTGLDQIVAVLDTGIDLNHSDLRNNLWRNENELQDGLDNDSNNCVDDIVGCNFTSSGPPHDGHGHGTHVAGTIAAVANNFGVKGVAYNTKLVAVKMLSNSGGGSIFTAIKAVEYVVALKQAGHNVVAINASWGSKGYSKPLELAIKKAAQEGVLFIAASGNSNYNTDGFPSHYPSSMEVENVVSVGAIDDRGMRAAFSNYGLNTVDLFAPGVSILSTFKNNTYKRLNGTSMAAPHVTGVAALLPGTMTERKNKLLSNTIPLRHLESLCTTGGILNAPAAIANATPPCLPVCKKKKCQSCARKCKKKYSNKHRRKQCRIKCRYTFNCPKNQCKVS